MKRNLILVALVVFGGLVSMLASAQNTVQNTGQSTTMDKPKACYGAFEFTIHQGSTAPLMLLGQVKLVVTQDGDITGTLSGNKGKSLVARGKLSISGNRLEIVGQAVGRSVSLVIKLPNGKRVFGTGASEYPLVSCQGPIEGELGGVAAGPQSGDRGDWLTKCRKFKDPENGCD